MLSCFLIGSFLRWKLNLSYPVLSLSFISYTTEWETVLRSGCKPDPQHPALAFSAEEQGSLLALPHRSHKLAESERVPVFLTLLDILFAERYDLRINKGESGPESGWCIAKLSPSLSSCTKHASLKQTIYSSIRRLVNFLLSSEICHKVR